MLAHPQGQGAAEARYGAAAVQVVCADGEVRTPMKRAGPPCELLAQEAAIDLLELGRYVEDSLHAGCALPF